MRIIQCDKCGKRYKVREIDNGQPTLKYKCNACFQLIVAANTQYPQDPFNLETTGPRPSSKNPHESKNSRPEYNTTDLDATSDTSTGRSLRLKKAKFNLVICAVFLFIIVMLYFWADSRLHKDAEEQVFGKAHLLLTTMESSRSFTSNVIKPALYKAMPGRFITEAMSSSFGARNIFERIHKTYPQYYFKHAAPHPRNPINQADAFEVSIIKKFSDNPNLKEWKGYRTRGEQEEYSIMKPIVAEKRCMHCHSDPALAPQELLDRYGDKNGFGRSVGEVIGTLTVSVPVSVVIDKARNNTLFFIAMVVLFFVSSVLILNIFFSKMVLKPIKYLADIADEISHGKLDTQVNTSGGDEIAQLAKAFDRMKISIKMAFEQLAK